MSQDTYLCLKSRFPTHPYPVDILTRHPRSQARLIHLEHCPTLVVSSIDSWQERRVVDRVSQGCPPC